MNIETLLYVDLNFCPHFSSRLQALSLIPPCVLPFIHIERADSKSVSPIHIYKPVSILHEGMRTHISSIFLLTIPVICHSSRLSYPRRALPVGTKPLPEVLTQSANWSCFHGTSGTRSQTYAHLHMHLYGRWPRLHIKDPPTNQSQRFHHPVSQSFQGASSTATLSSSAHLLSSTCIFQTSDLTTPPSYPS